MKELSAVSKNNKTGYFDNRLNPPKSDFESILLLKTFQFCKYQFRVKTQKTRAYNIIVDCFTGT